MKSAFVIILLLSFFGVAALGFMSMVSEHMHDGGCIAYSGVGAPCFLSDIVSFVFYHLNAFKYFSTAVLAAVLLVLISGMIFSLLPRPLDEDEEDDFIFSIQNRKSPILSKSKEIIHWLSLHINSPAFVLAAI